MQSVKTNGSSSSLSGLLRRNLSFLTVLGAVFLMFGTVLTKASFAQLQQLTYHVSGYTHAEIDPNGANSLLLSANGYLSWDCPTSQPDDLIFTYWIYVDDALYSKVDITVSKDSLSPSTFSLSAPLIFSSGTHTVHFYSGFHHTRTPQPFSTDYGGPGGGTGAFEWNLYATITVP